MFNAQNFWQQRHLRNYLLLPLTFCYQLVVNGRSLAYRLKWLPVHTVSIPVIVVGNIVVGGGGKTPLVIAIVRQLLKMGHKPGVVSRGYAKEATDSHQPLLVNSAQRWQAFGDEPMLIHQATSVPVSVSVNRPLAAKQLLDNGCTVIVSDDGLQHYALHRDIEICVHYASYQYGNGWMLPAGPLRESPQRAQLCDINIQLDHTLKTNSSESLALYSRGFYYHRDDNDNRNYFSGDFFQGKKIVAVAGIAQPHRFFDSVKQHGVTITDCIALPDHGSLSKNELNLIDADFIIMSAKDAVKYPYDTDNRIIVLESHCRLNDALLNILSTLNP